MTNTSPQFKVYIQPSDRQPLNFLLNRKRLYWVLIDRSKLVIN